MDGNLTRSWNYILLNGCGNTMSLPSCNIVFFHDSRHVIGGDMRVKI